MDDLRKTLFRALEKSDINMLRTVLARGVSLDYVEGDPDPVCFVGWQYDGILLDALKMLQASGADLLAREPEYDDTLLHWCVNDRDADVLPWLIAQGLDVNARNRMGRSPLMFAGKGLLPSQAPDLPERAFRDIQRLLMAGARADNTDIDGGTALHTAAFAGRPDYGALLLAHGAAVNAARTGGETALHIIAERAGEDMTDGHRAMIDLLLAAGADIEAVDDYGSTPLASTTLHDNDTVARWLIERGACVNAGNGDPLRQACSDADKVFDVLLGAGAAFDIPWNDEMLLPLGLAAHNDSQHCVEALLDRGADIESVNADGETALLIAVRRRKHDVVACLLTRGADRNHIDHYSNTALSWATRRGDARLIEMLSQ